MAELIKILFALSTRVGPRNHVLDVDHPIMWVQIAPSEGGIFRGKYMPGMPADTLPGHE